MNPQIVSIHLTIKLTSLTGLGKCFPIAVWYSVVGGMGKLLREPGVRQCYLPHLQQSPTVFEQPRTDDCQNKDTLLQKGQTRVVKSAGEQTLLMELYQE